ncbi:MAG: outer membrane protein transport protein [Mariprofundaceae bacterium]|nr:outer membrane protein transport protein [Mariprofundaceae bacterium]
MKRLFAVAGLLCVWGSGTISSQAAGFANNDFSASGVGVANAMVAGVADVTAASYNPAAIAWLDGGVYVEGDFASRSRNSSVKLPSGAIQPNTGSARNASTLHAAWMSHDSDIGVSFAFTQPFEGENVWAGNRTSIKTDRLSLDLVYALSSTLAVAHGIDVYRTTINMTQGAASFTGKDKASFGVNVGVNWKPAPLWQVGMMLRSGTKAKVKSGSQQVDLRLPEQVTLGVSYDMSDALRLEADLAYERWSRLKNLDVSGSTIRNATDLKDTLALKTGVTWYWLPDTTLRFGYAYEQGANRASAFQQAIADQSGHRLSLGAGGDVFGAHVDVAYAYTFHAKQSVTAPVAGEYRDRKQALMISLSKAF